MLGNWKTNRMLESSEPGASPAQRKNRAGSFRPKTKLTFLLVFSCAFALLLSPAYAQEADQKKAAPVKKQSDKKQAATETNSVLEKKKQTPKKKVQGNKADAKSKKSTSATTADKKTGQTEIPDPKQVGGEPDGIVQVANLVYAGTKSSECFADHFLVQAEQDSSISTSRRFHAIKLDSAEIYNFPLVIMTGEGAFTLPAAERENLKRFVQRGGFLLASAGCSSKEWDTSFRREMNTIFGEKKLAAINMEHPVFHTVYDITQVGMKHGKMKPLEGISIEGRLGVLYSQDGLNDTAHTTGCCCCGGNEIKNSIQINVNILAYALTH